MAEITEMQMSYEGLVEAGREARKQVDSMQWTEGDLALQVEALPSHDRPRDPETGDFIKDEVKALKRYAEDIDIPYSTMQDYRRTAEAWPQDGRAPGVGWMVHKTLATQEDRFELIREEGMTTRRARKIVSKRRLANYHPPGWFELLGGVSEYLLKAEKELTKFEQATEGREFKAALHEKADEYSEQAEELMNRLKEIANG